MGNSNIEASGTSSQAAGRDIINNVDFHKSFIFDPKDLAELIDELSEDIINDVDPDSDFLKINIDEKNKKNNLSNEFYEECIKEENKYFSSIEKFLKNPKNERYKNKFFGIVSVLKPKVMSALHNGVSMESILSNLFDYFFETKEELKSGKKEYIMLLAYYIYHNCYIGRK